MTLSTKHRSSLYQSLAPLVGAEEADALLNELPSADGDQLVTKDFLRAELSTEVGGLRLAVERGFRRQTMLMASLVLTAMSLQTAMLALVR